MKRIATLKTIAALMLSLGVAGVYAQPGVNMTLSGTAAPGTVNLGTGAGSSEYNLVGNGTLGSFTLRLVSAGTGAPEQSSTCSGLYFSTKAGQGVFRFQDGSLLSVNLTGGSDCIDLVAKQAQCIRIFSITGGTGRFKNASGDNVTLTMALLPVSGDNPVFFAVTATLTGTVSGVAIDLERQNTQQ
jgi:hypothetical protein